MTRRRHDLTRAAAAADAGRRVVCSVGSLDGQLLAALRNVKIVAGANASTVSRLQTEIANRQTQLGELHARQAQAADRDSRRARLLDALANGPAILRDADPTQANVWLRTHIRLWLKDKEVLIVEWL